jgi:transposase
MGYSEKHRNVILQKVLPPNNRPVHEVSKETGVAVQTIYKWLNMIKDGSLKYGDVEDTPPCFKTDLEKFSLIIESKSITEDKLGEWLRVNGVHSEHLKLWEQELATKMTVREEKYREENKNLRKELLETKRELNKKEKALAEMAALYTLKKKAEQIWGDNAAD